MSEGKDYDLGSAIAIVGMSCRVPGASDPEALWKNLLDGVESIEELSVEELLAGGLDPELLSKPEYVRRAAALDGMEMWDAGFFGLSPKEAAIMDPQQRHFLELSWEAMEAAGYAPGTLDGPVGVFAGCGPNTYMMFNILADPRVLREEGFFAVRHIGNDKDFIATRVSYHLDLGGPSVGVQSACSTSLNAVHLAIQSLLSYECDMALAGGITISFPHRLGYLYSEEEVLSPDGRCRAFDADSSGMVLGDGGAVVVLRRLSDAMAAGDTIHAVIRGSATNNDGSAKAGYWAPGVDGQARVISEALAVADVEPDSVGYVEAHGTGTPLGDSIEVAALTLAFRAGTDRVGYCGLGSVKNNIGHLDTAAGAASLIKATFAVKHGVIPPMLHLRKPNPELGIETSPFTLSAEGKEWQSNGAPRRAGVNSFGVGGTNVHVVLEQPPEVVSEPDARSAHLVVLSGRSAGVVDRASARLAAHIRGHPEQSLADVAWTLQAGRAHFRERRFVVGSSAEEVAAALTEHRASAHHTADDARRSAIFHFESGDAAYRGMAAGLYRSEPRFREEMNRGLAALDASVRERVARFLDVPHAASSRSGGISAPEDRARASVAFPALFLVQNAISALLMSWGVKPSAVSGREAGACAAARTAGVFSTEEALELSVLLGALVDASGEGDPHSSSRSPGDLSSHAAPLRERLARVRPQPTTIPFPSHRTGSSITAEEAADPEYWIEQLAASTAEGSPALGTDPSRVQFVVGPTGTDHDELFLLRTLGRLWQRGVEIDWSAVHGGVRRLRVPLPTYPFEHERHLIEPVYRLDAHAAPELTPDGRTSAGVDGRANGPRAAAVSMDGTHAGAAANWLDPDATPTERTIAEVWRKLLGVKRLELDASFFELGGHSLLAMRASSRLRALGLDLPLRRFFETPTVAGLAAAVEGAAPAHAAEIPRVSRDQALSPGRGQERLLLLARMGDLKGAYNLGMALRMEGALYVPALERAMARVVERHEVLRTRYPTRDGVPGVAVEAPGEVSFARVRVERGASDDGWSEARALAVKLVESPYDLENGPLWRGSLFELDEGITLFVMGMHHLVGDGWSWGILLEELVAEYREELGTPANPRPALDLQFLDFAAWHRDHGTEAEKDRHIEYWVERLKDTPTLLLPTRGKRPQEGTYRGEVMEFRIPETLLGRMEEKCSAEGATLFMGLLSAYMLLLSRYSGQNDFAVGIPTAGRIHEGTERLIGFFTNTLALRAPLAEARTVDELLRRVKEEVIAGLDHQEAPFDQVVEAVGLPRDRSRSPVFQVMFNLPNTPMPELDFPELRTDIEILERRSAMFDQTLWVYPEGGGIRCEFEYNTDLFDPDFIRSMSEHYIRAVEAVAGSGDQPWQEVGLLGDEEQEALVKGRAGLDAPELAEGNFLEWVQEQVIGHPEDAAVRDEQGRRLTYSELWARSGHIAAALRKRGLERESLVGVLLERTADLVPVILGVLRSGAAYLPIDPEYPEDRIRYVLEDGGCALLIADETPETENGLERVAPEALAREGATGAEEPGMDGTAESGNAHSDITPGGSPPSADDLAYVIYTSGSTGNPKGVEITHGALRNFLGAMREDPELVREDVLVAVTTLSFDISALELYLPLCVGAQVVVADAETVRSGYDLADRLEEFGATVMQGTPATWRMLLDAGWEGSLQKVLCGGEAFPAELARELVELGGRIWNLYGPTETTVWSMVDPVESGDDIRVGRAIANTRIYVLNPEGAMVPDGATGEIWIAGAGVARGYRNRPELTDERFRPDPFVEGGRMYRTGDLGRWGSDARLEHLGRVDYQVKVQGFRIELGEIEATLEALDEVRQAVVMARGEAADRRLVAYVVFEETKHLSATEMRRKIGASLPLYMIPGLLMPLESLPLTDNGKVDRKALPDPLEGAARVTTFDPPRNFHEEVIAGVFARLLNVERVGRDTNFFEAGGHSLLTLRAVAEIEREGGFALAPRDLFFRNVAQLASTVIAESGEAGGKAAATPQPPGRDRAAGELPAR